MIVHPRPLIEVCAMIPDFRKPRGKRHPLAAIFAPACCAMLYGARRYSAIAEWGRNDGLLIAQALGFTHATPCAATLHTIVRHVNRDEFETHLGAWADGVVGSLPPGPETPETAVALDGKTLRGSKKQGAPGTHLLSALAHHVGVTLAQHAVETLLQQLLLEGRIVTMDALLTQRHIAQTLGEKGEDYVMIVKENQPRLRAETGLIFTLPPVGDRQDTARTVGSGAPRTPVRKLGAGACDRGIRPSQWSCQPAPRGDRRRCGHIMPLERIRQSPAMKRCRPTAPLDAHRISS